MTEAAKTASGVQELVARIRDEGTKAGQDEADRLIGEVRREAARIVDKVRTEANELRDQTHAALKADEEAATAALRNAARDSILQLRATVRAKFENFVQKLITDQMRDEGFLESLVLVLAGHASDEFIKNQEARIFVNETLLGDRDAPLSESVQTGVLQISGEMLREGIELIPSSEVRAGARVQLVGENLEIDLSDEAIAELLLRYVLPRYRRIVEEGT